MEAICVMTTEGAKDKYFIVSVVNKKLHKEKIVIQYSKILKKKCFIVYEKVCYDSMVGATMINDVLYKYKKGEIKVVETNIINVSLNHIKFIVDSVSENLNNIEKLYKVNPV